jgi:putative ABC transport system permease protein
MSKPTVASDFQDGSHGTLRWASRAGTTLVVIETALALVLLSGGGLMVRSLWNVLSVDPGFDTRRTLVIEAAPAIDGTGRSSGPVTGFYADLIDRVKTLPGVEAAGAVDMLPFWSNSMSTMEIDGREPARTSLSNRRVTPGYFGAIGMRLVAGRDFASSDRAGSPCVAIVNEKTVREQWPGLDPLGRRVRPYQAKEWCEIVGVVNDIRHGGFERASQPEIFFSAYQGAPAEHGDLSIVARAADPGSLVAAARTLTGQLGVPTVVEQVAPFDHFVDRVVATRKNRAVLLSFLGGLGALLAALGIFGIVSYAVARKTTEIGIRVALGATGARVVKTVVGGFVPAIAGGVVLGLAGALALARLLATLLPATPDRSGTISSPLAGNGGILFGITPTDPLTFATLSGLLVIVGLLACYLPARRASRVDPIVALRCE